MRSGCLIRRPIRRGGAGRTLFTVRGLARPLSRTVSRRGERVPSRRTPTRSAACGMRGAAERARMADARAGDLLRMFGADESLITELPSAPARAGQQAMRAAQ
ncbi:hypothetical protein Ato02nite_017610 [Paractinoplanes toevensis]|uniref:Uncharacterized protein n=1 Tax=Paractinoplanes toevensis TaxID=571911 RepID=A0A919T6W6_9ACTN|nr:hypothetical protein Ato02nite_017610 [Actinoplanes toevensis]